MIEELTKAARIASDKGGLPIMAAVLVKDGVISAGNGAVSIRVPCPDLAGHSFAVDADRFLAAVKASDGAPKLKLTDGGKLSVTHGKFRALIPLMDADNYPVAEYPETGAACPLAFIDQLRRVAPFIATDKARPWAIGAMLKGNGSSAIIATNGTTLVRGYLDGALDRDAVLPLTGVEALLGVKSDPDRIAITANACVFYWPDGTVMSVRLLAHQWPDIDKLLDAPADYQPVPLGLADAIKRVMPFCPNKDHPIIRLTADGKVCTADGDSSGVVGGFTFAQDSAFIASELLAVLELADRINLSAYPAAVPFSGEQVHGVLAGVRL